MVHFIYRLNAHKLSLNKLSTRKNITPDMELINPIAFHAPFAPIFLITWEMFWIYLSTNAIEMLYLNLHQMCIK